MAETPPEPPSAYAATSQHRTPPSIHAAPGEYERGALAWASRASQSLGNASHPFLASIERQATEELPDGSVTANTTAEEGGVPLYKEIRYKSEWTVSLDETLDFDLDQFLTRLYTISVEHASQMTKSILNHISAVSEEYGQVVNAKDGSFFEAICESLEKLEFVFDDDGNHNIKLVLNPHDAKVLEPITPEQQLVLDQIVHRKREEWNAKRRRRNFPRIPD